MPAIQFDAYQGSTNAGKSPSWEHPPYPLALREGQPLPRDPNLTLRERCRSFWRASYQGGPAYKHAKDCDGLAVFVAHECESKEAQARRQRLSSYRNYCRSIVDRYVNLVYSSGGVSRDQSNEDFMAFVEDADLLGTHLHDLMRGQTTRAMIEGEAFVLVDSTKTIDADMTMLDAREAGNRIFAVPLPASRVPAVRMDGPALLEAIVTFPDEGNEDGGYVARLYATDRVEVAQVNKAGIVTSVQVLPNDFGSCQVVRVTCQEDGTSFLQDIAELNKSVYNLDAIHREELTRQTFTSWLAVGLRKDDIEQAFAGGRKIACVSREGNVALNKLSADVQQAQSLRDAIKDDISEMFRLAGLSLPEIQAAESGRALKIRFIEIENRARLIADMAEKAEEAITDLWANGMNQEVQEPEYPEQFLPEDQTEDIAQVKAMRDAGFPPEAIARMIEQVVMSMFDLSPEEATAVIRQMDATDQTPPDGGPTTPDGEGE